MKTTKATQVKERPILFQSEMVRAILKGSKTQTRRVVKHPEWYGCPTGDCPHQTQHECDQAMNDPNVLDDCPYGQRGDRLWVREAFQFTADIRGQSVIRYRADDSAKWLLAEDGGEGDLCGVEGKADSKLCHPIESWRPSIHLPRWASRITLEVVGVRVERLRSISEADAIAEGVTRNGHLVGWPVQHVEYTQSARDAYERLWESINGPESLSENPCVWVVEFKRAKGSGAA